MAIGHKPRDRRMYRSTRARSAASTIQRAYRKYSSGKTVQRGKPKMYASAPFPLGNCLRTKLKYSEVINVAPATYFLNTNFNINNAYDPNATSGTNKRPLGWTEVATFYSNYRCYGVKYKVRFINTYTAPLMGSVIALNATSAYSTPDEISAAAGARSKLLTPAASQDRPQIIKGYVGANQVLGISKGQYEDATFDGTTDGATTPESAGYLDIVVAAVTGTPNITANVLVELTYYLKFWERKNLALSAA